MLMQFPRESEGREEKRGPRMDFLEHKSKSSGNYKEVETNNKCGWLHLLDPDIVSSLSYNIGMDKLD